MNKSIAPSVSSRCIQVHVHVHGVGLHVEVTGEGPALLLLHGFTGSVAAWQAHLPALARHNQVVAVDLIGHGRSDAPTDPARYSMDRCVVDLLAVLDHLGIARAAVLGYSMGARVALHLAAVAPDRVAALVLESGSPGLATLKDRAARRAADDGLAARIERDGVAAFVDFWEGLPLFASQRTLSPTVRLAQRRLRLRNGRTGLANSLRGMGTGAQESLWARLAAITVPTLVIAGALDDKFRNIAQRMADALPRAELEIVRDVGHAIHLERPAVFDQLVADFLADQSGGAGAQPRDSHLSGQSGGAGAQPPKLSPPPPPREAKGAGGGGE